jgi:hypothetical protein
MCKQGIRLAACDLEGGVLVHVVDGHGEDGEDPTTYYNTYI